MIRMPRVLSASLGLCLIGQASPSLAQSRNVGEGHHRTSVNGIAFSPDGRLLASVAGGNTEHNIVTTPGEVIVWLNLGEDHPHVSLGGHVDGVTCVSFSPDGTTLATGGYDGGINVWEVGKWRRIASMGHSDEAVLCLAYAPDGKTLVSGGTTRRADGTIPEARLWDTHTHTLIGTFKGHQNGINSVRFSPDGKRLATGSMDGTVRIWNVADRRQETVLPVAQGVQSVAFSPDGTLLAAGGGKIVLWQCKGWNAIDAFGEQTTPVSCLTFSPDGKTLASCGSDDTITRWDVERRVKVQTPNKGWRGLEGGPTVRGPRITTAAFSPDGRYLTSGDSRGLVVLDSLWAERLSGGRRPEGPSGAAKPGM